MRVLVVDDHEFIRRGVRSILLAHSNYDVCGEAVDGQDAVERARDLKPDVVVMDISMPKLNGFEATRLIRTMLPDTEVLILSQHESPQMVQQAFKAGARGYVTKSSVPKHLLSALDQVSRHQPFFDPEIAQIGKPAHIDAQEISQRSAALEQALRESEELYRSTFDLAAVGVAHVSPDGRWLRVNNKFCEIVGYSEDELLKMTFKQITHPQDVGEDLAQAERLRAGTSETYSTEKRYIHRDGSPVWVNLTVSPVRGQVHELRHFITVIEDITERKRIEEARFRLAAIVESSDDAIVSKDLNGVITSWNEAAVRIFGFAPEEAIGRPITIIIPPELHDEEKQILKRLRNDERIQHYETIRVSKSGKKLNVSLTISPVKDSKNRIVGASKIARDITESKRIENALTESETRLRATLSQTYSFLILLKPDGTIIDANHAAVQAAGCKREEVLGQKFWEPWWSRLPEEVAILKNSVAKAARGEPVQELCYFCLPDGTRRFAHRTLKPVPGDDGNISMIVATALDMTEQKELRDKLDARFKRSAEDRSKRNMLERVDAQRTMNEVI